MNARRVLPALLLLFVGSGCAALIYEIVWFQLLQLVIGSSAVSLGVLLGTFMGGHVPGQPVPRAGDFRAPASAEGLRVARDRDRRLRHSPAVRHAAARRRLLRVGRLGRDRHPAARRGGEHLPAAADAAHGRDAAGDVALGRVHARGGLVAGLLLRRQHRRRRARVPAGRVLPAARARQPRGDVRRGRVEPDRRGRGAACIAKADAAYRGRRAAGDDRARLRRLGGLRRRSASPA